MDDRIRKLEELSRKLHPENKGNKEKQKQPFLHTNWGFPISPEEELYFYLLRWINR